jgi:integrase
MIQTPSHASSDAGVRPADVEALHRKVSSVAPTRANRCVSTLSKMMSLAIRWEMRSDNPCKGAIERNAETKRKRYLKPDEFTRLSDALAAYPYMAPKFAIGLLVATGARRMEVLSATWSQFDIPARTWLKPATNTKQKQDHLIPLSGTAIDLLERLQPDPNRRTGYLFPGRAGHLTDIKHPWSTISAQAGIPDVKLYDLRHSFASAAVSLGYQLPDIGALLGHSNAQTTSRYADLMIERLREATEQVGNVVSGK